MKPLTDLNEFVIEHWPRLLPGFLKVLDHSTDVDDIADILRCILNGENIVWLVDDDYNFVTTRLVTYPTGAKHLIIDHAKFPIDSNVVAEVDEFLLGFAKRLGCSKVKASTLRGGVGKLMKRRGFEEGFCEYERNV